MSTFRKAKNKDNPFVMVDKTWINNPNLSAKAKGILLYILSKPDDWIIYEIDICNHMKDGRDSIRSGIKELISIGHIHRTACRDELGRFKGYEHMVYENPLIPTKSTEDGKPDIGKPHTTNNERTNSRKRKEWHDDPRCLSWDEYQVGWWSSDSELD